MLRLCQSRLQLIPRGHLFRRGLEGRDPCHLLCVALCDPDAYCVDVHGCIFGLWQPAVKPPDIGTNPKRRPLSLATEEARMRGMTASQAIRHAGSMRALGRIVGVSHQAIAKWVWRGIPDRQLERLRELRPEWFKRGRK